MFAEEPVPCCPVIVFFWRRVWRHCTPVLDHGNAIWIDPPIDGKVGKIVRNSHYPVALSRHFALKQSVTGRDQIADERHLREDGLNAEGIDILEPEKKRRSGITAHLLDCGLNFDRGVSGNDQIRAEAGDYGRHAGAVSPFLQQTFE